MVSEASPVVDGMGAYFCGRMRTAIKIAMKKTTATKIAPMTIPTVANVFVVVESGDGVGVDDSLEGGGAGGGGDADARTPFNPNPTPLYVAIIAFSISAANVIGEDRVALISESSVFVVARMVSLTSYVFIGESARRDRRLDDATRVALAET